MQALDNPPLQSICADLSHKDRICVQRQLMPGDIFISKEHSKSSANGKGKKRGEGKGRSQPPNTSYTTCKPFGLQYIAITAHFFTCNKDT